MAEVPALDAGGRDLLQRRLMDLCDAYGPELVGLCSALEGLARIVRADVASAGLLPPAVVGLCYVAGQAEESAGRILAELHRLHGLALGRSDG